MLKSPAHHIYWATVRDQNKRVTYFEMEEVADGKWSVVLDDREVTVKLDSQNPWRILQAALNAQFPI